MCAWHSTSCGGLTITAGIEAKPRHQFIGRRKKRDVSVPYLLDEIVAGEIDYAFAVFEQVHGRMVLAMASQNKSKRLAGYEGHPALRGNIHPTVSIDGRHQNDRAREWIDRPVARLHIKIDLVHLDLLLTASVIDHLLLPAHGGQNLTGAVVHIFLDRMAATDIRRGVAQAHPQLEVSPHRFVHTKSAEKRGVGVLFRAQRLIRCR